MGGKAGGGKGGIDEGFLNDILARGVNLGDKYYGLSESLYNMVQPTMAEVNKQAMQTLQGGYTGGTGPIQPLITQAVEAQKLAGSQAQKQAGEQMARFGLTGTPYGQNILSGMQQAGEFNLARIPTEMAYNDYWKRIGAFLPSAIGQISPALSGMGGAVSAGTGLAGTAMGTSAQQAAMNMGMFGDIFKEFTSPGK